MICPKCGKDCADAKFCPECGARLEAEDVARSYTDRRRMLQASGEIYCRRCLSTSYCLSEKPKGPRASRSAGSILLPLLEIFGRHILKAHYEEYGDKYICMKCGNEWFSKRVALYERYWDHISELLGNYSEMKYPGINGTYLELNRDQVIINLAKNKGCIISLDELAAVDYQRSFGPIYGRLSIRDRAHRKRPFPKTIPDAEKDRNTIFYDPRYRISYYQLYTALNAIVEENKKAGLL